MNPLLRSRCPLLPLLRLLLLAALAASSIGGTWAQAGAADGGPGAASGRARDAERFFASNQFGMPLMEIGWYRREEFPYVLSIQGRGEEETRVLYHQGSEVKRWERRGREERTLEEGKLVELTLSDASGRVIEQQEYEAGTLASRTVYSFPSPTEMLAQTYAADGALLYRDRVLLSAQGGLRGVRRELPEGGERRLGVVAAGDRLFEERVSAGERSLIRRFDAAGRLVEEETWSGGGLVEKQGYTYREDSRQPESTVRLELPSGKRSTEFFDEAGHLVRATVEEEDRLVEETAYEWDPQGRKTGALCRGPQGLEQWSYAYDEGGELVREEYRLRGSLERVTLYPGKDGKVEELYRQGALFLRITYSGGEKVKEEFIRDGQVIRTRQSP